MLVYWPIEGSWCKGRSSIIKVYVGDNQWPVRLWHRQGDDPDIASPEATGYSPTLGQGQLQSHWCMGKIGGRAGRQKALTLSAGVGLDRCCHWESFALESLSGKKQLTVLLFVYGNVSQKGRTSAWIFQFVTKIYKERVHGHFLSSHWVRYFTAQRLDVSQFKRNGSTGKSRKKVRFLEYSPLPKSYRYISCLEDVCVLSAILISWSINFTFQSAIFGNGLKCIDIIAWEDLITDFQAGIRITPSSLFIVICQNEGRWLNKH